MLLVLLDALGAIGEAEVLLLLGKWLVLGVLPLGLLGCWWLEKSRRGPQWYEARRQHDEQRLARRIQLTEKEAQQQASAKRGYGRLLLLLILAIAAIVALEIWQG